MRLVACLIAVAALFMGAAPAPVPAAPPVEAPPKSVLILSEGPVLPYAAFLREHLITTLRREDPEPLNIYEEMIDRIRFDSDEYRAQLVALYKSKYVGMQAPTVVITITEPALDFFLSHRQELFPDAALIFGGVDQRAIANRTLGSNSTGVYSRIDVRKTVETALSLHPGTRQVVVVGGTSRLDRGYMAVAREDLRDLKAPVALTYITDKSLADAMKAVAALPRDAIVVLQSFQVDGSGVTRTGPEAVAALRSVSNVPIYGMSGNFLGVGIVGGAMFDMTIHGEDLARRTRQVLEGTRADDLAPITSRNTLAFDSRELRRFGIDEARLPVGATVQFRQVGLWQQYRPQIIGVSLLIVLQAALIGTLLLQRKRRRRVESALLDSQNRYSLASAAGAVGIWDWNFETNELFIDSRLKSLLGFDDAEISTRPQDWGSKVHPQDLADSGAAVQACMDGHTDIYQVEHRMLHKNGSVRWMLSRGSAIRGADGRLRRLVGTKVDITERKIAEESIRENQAVLRSSHQQIQDLAGLLIASQEVERSRIARELHDDLSQQTAGLSIALSALKRRLGAQPETSDLSGDISLLQERALGLAEHIRNLSHDLHPSVLQHAGLVAALAAHCSDIQRQYPLIVTFSAGEDVEVTPELALCLYRVTQEALRNTVTHSGARRAEVRLSRLNGHVELTIEDDGRGFDTAKTAKGSRGLGLVSINERVRLAGGTVSLVTELGKGTRVRVQIPAAAHVLVTPQA